MGSPFFVYYIFIIYKKKNKLTAYWINIYW